MALNKIREFLTSDEWDAPFFKRLAHNDTGRAKGHQAGLVIPKALRPFFPTLDEARTSRQNPTVDRAIRVDMYVGLKSVGHGIARYQFQTWGGERPPEGRLTDNLGPLRSVAESGNILIFQRSVDALDHFRLMLLRRGMGGYGDIISLVRGRRWGTVIEDEEPVTSEDLERAEGQFDELARQPFVLKTSRRRVETRLTRVARSSAFPGRVNREYGGQCAVSGVILRTPSNIHEVQAAHIVPVSEGGTDDIRNGLALSHTLHWAFDWGLFGVGPDRRVYVPRRVRRLTANSFLRQFSGRLISEARSDQMHVHPMAFAWHMKHRVRKWE